MITQLNSNYCTYLVQWGTTHVFCNLKQVPKVLNNIGMNIGDTVTVYQFIENGKKFVKVDLAEITQRIKNANK